MTTTTTTTTKFTDLHTADGTQHVLDVEQTGGQENGQADPQRLEEHHGGEDHGGGHPVARGQRQHEGDEDDQLARRQGQGAVEALQTAQALLLPLLLSGRGSSRKTMRSVVRNILCDAWA